MLGSWGVLTCPMNGNKIVVLPALKKIRMLVIITRLILRLQISLIIKYRCGLTLLNG